MHWHERVSRRLKLRDVRIFLTVVQRGSMAKAASSLAMSQPAVSKAISDLEHLLGVRLLDRSSRGVEPTSYGLALMKRGMIVFDELRQGVSELEHLKNPTSGEIRIGASEGMAAGILPKIIDRMLLRYPKITITVTQAIFTSSQHRELRDRNVDLLFGRIFEPVRDDDLAVEALFDDQMVVVTGKQSPLASRRTLKLGDLLGQKWILPPNDTVAGDLAGMIFRENSLQVPQAPVFTLSIHLALKLATTGRYVALLPTSIVHDSLRDAPLRILPVKLPLQARPVGIITLKNRTPSPVAGIFTAYIRQFARGALSPKIR